MVLRLGGPTVTRPRWRDGDLQWLGVLLAGLSATLMIALIVLVVLLIV